MSCRPPVLLLSTLCALLSAAENSSILTTVDALAGQLQDPQLVILHVGTPKDYDAGHIKGARLVTLADLSVTGTAGLRLEMPPIEKLREALLKLGVADGKRVVVYAGNESVQSATRVWFTFDYLGWGNRAALLDGGLAAWRAAGKPTAAGEEDAESRPKAGATLSSLKANPKLIVDAAWLRSRVDKPGLRLIDARLPEFYTGAGNSGMPRAGRIPGAINVPFSTLINPAADRKLLPAAELKSKVAGGASVKGELVTYCHIGQQATLVYFTARYLGLKPKLYDGSFQDWSSRPDLPVVKD